MSIPKVIHYCWFGGNPLPRSAKKCIKSWKKYCPDYKIIRWDESNFDIRENRYAAEAYQCKKWAFVSDYARLKIICDRGGIYLDTDVELLRPLDDLLENQGFLGFQDDDATVATGLGLGAEAGQPMIRAMLDDYRDIPFLKEDGTMDMTSCPHRNTQSLIPFGLRPDGTRQEVCGLQIFPRDYFCPISLRTGELQKTDNTYSIHHFDASWVEDKRFLHFMRTIRIKQHVPPVVYWALRFCYRRCRDVSRLVSSPFRRTGSNQKE